MNLFLKISCFHGTKGIYYSLAFITFLLVFFLATHCVIFYKFFYLHQQNAYCKGELDMSETITQSQTEQLNASQKQLDVLDQLLNPEVQESLNTLVEQLPKLTELVNILTKSYDFAQSVATDDVLKNDTVSA